MEDIYLNNCGRGIQMKDTKWLRTWWRCLVLGFQNVFMFDAMPKMFQHMTFWLWWKGPWRHISLDHYYNTIKCCGHFIHFHQNLITGLELITKMMIQLIFSIVSPVAAAAGMTTIHGSWCHHHHHHSSLELQTKVCEDISQSRRRPTGAFTFKTHLRPYAVQMLTHG